MIFGAGSPRAVAAVLEARKGELTPPGHPHPPMRAFSPAHRAHLRAAMRRVWARRRAEPLPGRVRCPACHEWTELDPCAACGAAVRAPVAEP